MAFRPDIEGFRGLTILLVIAFHAGVTAVPGAFIAVDVFFVLSGFFLARLLLHSSGEGFDLPGFYARRAVRLLPLLFVMLFSTLALVMWLYAPIDRPAIAATARSVALSSVNIEFARDAVNYFFTEDNPLLHTWSLAVEQQVSLVWPLFLLIAATLAGGLPARDAPDARRARILLLGWIAAAAVASFALSAHLNGVSQPWAFFGTFTRIWEFALGSALAIALVPGEEWRVPGAPLQVAGLGAIAFAVATFDRGMPHPGLITLVPTLGAVALIAGGHASPDSGISRVLAAGAFQWLGRVSYAWYLWHWPFVGVGMVLDPGIGVPGKLAWSLVALLVAALSHHLIERPLREGGGPALRLPAAWLGPAALGASLAAALGAHGTMRIAERQAAHPSQRGFAAARMDRMRHECWARSAADVERRCEFGDRRSSTAVVLLGDSHAEHWLGALDRIGREQGWKVILMIKGGCPVAELHGLAARAARHYRECDRYREAAMRRIVAMRPAAVVLSNADMYVPGNGGRFDWQVTPEQWRGGLRRTYSRLADARIRTVVFRDNPNPPFDVPRCLSRRSAALPRARACEYDLRPSLSQAGIAAQDAAARGLPIRFVNMTDRICASATCPVIRDGVIVFTDDNHLTASFSRSVAPALAERLDAAWGTLAAGAGATARR